ncbi:hypothetical protein ABDJ41_11420 [Pedobacter sp. ASV1-7]|uniref:hypothetical protein n=1 Tax=Pedobacter sp. ASV1-7 TaxID=3145237 RepID=UPI0032E8616E
MKSIKPLHFVALCAFIVLLSCKKETKPQTEEPKSKKEEPVSPQPTDQGKYIPIKLEANGTTLTLKYKENSALLTEITDSDGSKTTIMYNADGFPQKLEKYKNGKLFFIDYYEQKDKKLTNKIQSFDHDAITNRTSPNGYYTLTYNDQLRISTIDYYNNNKALIKTSNLYYSESLNLSKISSIHSKTSYTYDLKNGISSNITFSELFTLQLEHWFLRCINNNLTTILSQENNENNIDFSYEYNDNGYPSKAILTSVKNKQSIIITYKRLE